MSSNKAPLTFRDLEYGQLFIVEGDTSEIWCKTPMADMYTLGNRYNNADGAFCTAVCVTSEKPQYMQCNPDAHCTIVKMKKKHLKMKE